MGVITQAVMVQADIDVSGMGPAQKVRLADEIFAKQPNLRKRGLKALLPVADQMSTIA